MSNLENLTDTERLILANQYEILSKFEDSDYNVVPLIRPLNSVL